MTPTYSLKEERPPRMSDSLDKYIKPKKQKVKRQAAKKGRASTCRQGESARYFIGHSKQGSKYSPALR